MSQDSMVGLGSLKRLLLIVCASVWSGADAAKTVVYDMSGSGGWNDPTRWVGGSVPESGDTVEIPAGRAVVATEDYDLYKTLNIKMLSGDSVLSFTAENGSNYYTPVAKDNQISGTGTIEKACAKLWCLSKPAKFFTGDWDIKQGAVVWAQVPNSPSYYFGTNSTSAVAAGRIFVRNGAYIDVGQYSTTDKLAYGYKEIHIAGRNKTGSQDGIGALHCGSWGGVRTNAFSCVVLDDDAYITGYGGGVALGIVGLSPTLPGYLDLNGHDLYLTEVYGRIFTLRLRNVLVTNSVPSSGGNIYIDGNSMGNRHMLRIDKDVVFDVNVKICPSRYGQVVWNNSDGEVSPAVAACLVAGGSAPNLVVSQPMTRDQTNRTEWAGAVEVGAGKSFQVDVSVDATRRALISGPLSGSGEVSLADNSQGQMILGGDNSAFTGTINVNGRDGFGSVMALRPETIPTPANVTVNGSTLVVPMENWSLQQYLDLANGVIYSNYVDGVNEYVSSVSMCLDSFPGGYMNLSLTDGQITDYANVALGVAGTGTVNVAALPSEGRVRFANYGGTMSFSGAAPLKIGSMLATSFADGADAARIVFDSASDVDIGSERILVGGLEGIGPSSVKGELYVTNSLIYNHASDGMKRHEGIEVGMNGEGRLEVVDSCVTGRLQMAGTPSSCASTILKGGRFVSWGYRGSGTITNATMVAKNGHGYLEIDGCNLTARGTFYACYYGSAGVIVQKSGSLRTGVEASSPFSLLIIGTHKGGGNPLRSIGQYWIKGGSGWSSHEIGIAGSGNGGTYDHGTLGVVTVDGVNASLESQGQNVYIGASPDSIGILNLNNGGTMKAKNILGSADTRHGVSYVNFNGGTYNYTGWGDSYLFGKEGQTARTKAPVSRITVYGGGGEVLLTSSDSNKFMGRPICAPSGNGIATVTWNDTTTKYPVCPAVSIVGDGFGASVMADYDSTTRTVKGIVVTSPGCDYTAATAFVRVGDQTNLFSIACALAPNDLTGGMTFRITDGSGKIRLDEANTYRGQTTLSGKGEFIISTANAFATSSAIALKGGTLNVADYSLADLTAPFKFMGGKITGSASSYTVPEGKMVIDCADILAGESYTVANNSNIVMPSTITVLNADQLEDHQHYTLLTLPANYSGTMPSFSGIPPKRVVKRAGNVLKLTYVWGAQFIIR